MRIHILFLQFALEMPFPGSDFLFPHLLRYSALACVQPLISLGEGDGFSLLQLFFKGAEGL